MKNDQRYIDLYVQRRRLLSLNARENEKDISILTAEIKALRDAGEVSEDVIKYAAYVPWR